VGQVGTGITPIKAASSPAVGNKLDLLSDTGKGGIGDRLGVCSVDNVVGFGLDFPANYTDRFKADLVSGMMINHLDPVCRIPSAIFAPSLSHDSQLMSPPRQFDKQFSLRPYTIPRAVRRGDNQDLHNMKVVIPISYLPNSLTIFSRSLACASR
jgi:hypothetical protein